MADTNPGHPGHLRIIETVKRSYAFTIWNWGYLFRISNYAVIFLIILSAISGFVEGSSEIASSFVELAALPLWAMIAVAWHRRILLFEIFKGHRYIRFGDLEKSYTLYSVSIGLILFAAGLLIYGLLWGLITLGLNARETGIILALAAFPVLLYIVARLSLILPAKALGTKVVTLAGIWRATGQNATGLFFGTLLCLMPLPILAFLLLWSFSGALQYLLYLPAIIVLPIGIVMKIIGVFLEIFLAGIYLSFLSFAFKQLYDLPDDLPSGSAQKTV